MGGGKDVDAEAAQKYSTYVHIRNSFFSSLCKDIRGLLAEAIMCFTCTTPTTPFTAPHNHTLHQPSTCLAASTRFKDTFKTACCLVKVAAGNAMAKAAGKIEGNPEKKSQLELQNATISSRVSHFFFFTAHIYTFLLKSSQN